jgi:5-methylcytosine-specific restriction endonuclease McrBC regulatory subunit McrC
MNSQNKIITSDNNCGYRFEDIGAFEESLYNIAGKSINQLCKENPDLLVLSSSYKDDVKDNNLFSYHNNTLTTNNIVGFLSVSNSIGETLPIQIHSRFDKFDNQYFLQHMLQKVFCPTFLDLEMNVDKENISEMFLAMLFPYYLKNAFRQGVFKKYKRFHYNNANVRGNIDVKRHIKENPIFNGNISYNTQEFSFDNHILQLIRHTFEYLKAKHWLFDRSSVFNEIATIIETVTPSYNMRERKQIMNSNGRPLCHPYFTEYEPLRKLCIRLLEHDGLSIKHSSKNNIAGIVFDAAWLWEEYLNVILKPLAYNHPTNKTSQGAVSLFGNRDGYPCYPDFYKDGVVLDAKYKFLDKAGNEMERKDIYQIVSYMHILKCTIGGFLYPINFNKEMDKLGELMGHGGQLFRIGLEIPANQDTYFNFVSEILKNENAIVNKVKELI